MAGRVGGAGGLAYGVPMLDGRITANAIARGWREFVYVALCLPIGLFWAFWLTLAIVLGLALSFVLIGLPMLVVTVLVWRRVAAWERERAALVLRRTGIDTDRPIHPLAMRWFDDPAILPFDCFDGGLAQATYSFEAPPALLAANVTLRGELLAATLAGQAAAVTMVRAHNGTRVYRVTPGGQTMPPQPPFSGPATVGLTVQHAPGHTGGAAFPEPVRLTCGTGKMAAGDWARVDALSCYSGGAVYARQITLTPDEANGPVMLDLGGVGATCEVAVNGESVRVRVCPPWRVDLTGRVKAGDNRLAVTVYNTLNNHYQTIPTRYRKPPAQEPSGLLGPVKLLFP